MEILLVLGWFFVAFFWTIFIHS